MNRNITFGYILIVLGSLVLLNRWLDLSESLFLGLLALCFFGLYLLNHQYGWLVPSGILGGLSAGIFLSHGTGHSSLVIIGLGLGFLAIYPIARLRGPTSRWPLIPGGILLGIGLMVLARSAEWLDPDILSSLGRLWPALLIILGIILIIRALR
ncbi:MAG TPA: DUF5668 domain-containing protein [Thermoanaerobaculia bacterium]|nr:DUF5668 domain-containing protein [Thermoanaerobaculia bacterium]HUM30568.1 DUF5668 domain-containing protein [Thermoanaerobaculia bacterium]HXK68760.1 DUF5668 domain-containing protein [Thermoanaerobaculia bacterium]